MSSSDGRTRRVANAVKKTTPTQTRLKGIIGSVLRRRINKSEKQLRPNVLQYLEEATSSWDGLRTAASSFSSDQPIPPSCWHYSAPAPLVSSRLEPKAKKGDHWWWHHPATLQSNDLAPWAIPDFTAHCMWLSDPRSLCASHEAPKGRFEVIHEDHAGTTELAHHPDTAEWGPAGIGYASMRSTPAVFSPGVLSRKTTPHRLVTEEVEAAMAGCTDKVIAVTDDRLRKAERTLTMLTMENTHEADADLQMRAVKRAGARHAGQWNSDAAHPGRTYDHFTSVKSVASQGFARAISMARDTLKSTEVPIFAAHDPFHSDWQEINGFARLIGP